MTQTNLTSLALVRKEAAKTIMDLRNGDISPIVADAIYKQSLTVVDSYRVQIRAIELAIQSSEGMDYTKALKKISADDIVVLPTK